MRKGGDDDIQPRHYYFSKSPCSEAGNDREHMSSAGIFRFDEQFPTTLKVRACGGGSNNNEQGEGDGLKFYSSRK
jgi:hypothetical protein